MNRSKYKWFVYSLINNTFGCYENDWSNDWIDLIRAELQSHIRHLLISNTLNYN